MALQTTESLLYRRTSTEVYCKESYNPQGHAVTDAVLRRDEKALHFKNVKFNIIFPGLLSSLNLFTWRTVFLASYMSATCLTHSSFFR